MEIEGSERAEEFDLLEEIEDGWEEHLVVLVGGESIECLFDEDR